MCEYPSWLLRICNETEEWVIEAHPTMKSHSDAREVLPQLQTGWVEHEAEWPKDGDLTIRAEDEEVSKSLCSAWKAQYPTRELTIEYLQTDLAVRYGENRCIVYKNGNKYWYNQQGQLHRINGPAIENIDSYKAWYLNGKKHRIDGPAKEHADGSKEWYKNGKLHRTNGPAIEWDNGYKYWYQNGKLHRTNGPAVEWANGYKAWYRNGKLHRTDGSAIEWANGSKEYWKNGKFIRKE